MRKYALGAAVAGIALILAVVPQFAERDGKSAAAQQPRDADEAAGDAVQRGRYLVHHVAMCVHCHSPHGRRGEIVGAQLLQGGRIPTPSPFPDRQWCFQAPKLAGLPGGWSEADLVEFLQTGRRDDWTPRPPMPPFRFNEEDAEAIVAYLKSLR